MVEVKCVDTSEGPRFKDEEEKIVTQDLIDARHKAECLHCKELPDQGNLFLWNCTIKVFRIRAIDLLSLAPIFSMRMGR